MQRSDEIASPQSPAIANPQSGNTRTWIVIIVIMAILAYVSVEFGVRAQELRLRIESCRQLAKLGLLMHESWNQGRAIPPDWLNELIMQGDDRAIDPRSRKPFIVMKADGPTTQNAKLDRRIVSARAPLARSPYISLLFGNDEGGAVLFADGHVQWLKRDEYLAAIESP